MVKEKNTAREFFIIQYIVGTGLIIVIALSIISIIPRMPFVYVDSIDIRGVDIYDNYEITQASIELLLSESYNIPHYTFLTLPTKSIKEYIYLAHPHIKNVHTSFKNIHSLQIDIEERTPIIKQCITPTYCVFIDKELSIFYKTSYEQQNLPSLGDTLVVDDTTLLEEIDFLKLIQVLLYLSDNNISIDTINKITEEEYDNQVIISTKDNFDILVNLDRPLYDITSNVYLTLFNVLGYKEESWEDIEYIDIRFKNGIYVK